MKKNNYPSRFPHLMYIGLLFGAVFVIACQNNKRSVEQESLYAEAIDAIFAEDDKIGAIRNHACEDTSLTETVRQYVSAIDALDFSQCPSDFTLAFKKHRDAWAATIPFWVPFDTLRGEMHELFAVIENMEQNPQTTFKEVIQPVTDTWGEVVKRAQEHGAMRND